MANSIRTLVTGDDIAVPIDLTKTKVKFSIGIGATVRTRIVSTDHKTALTGITASSNTASGADWPNSRIVAEFAKADTSGITTQGLALIEIEVIDNGVTTTWFAVVNLVIGQID